MVLAYLKWFLPSLASPQGASPSTLLGARLTLLILGGPFKPPLTPECLKGAACGPPLLPPQSLQLLWRGVLDLRRLAAVRLWVTVYSSALGSVRENISHQNVWCRIWRLKVSWSWAQISAQPPI